MNSDAEDSELQIDSIYGDFSIEETFVGSIEIDNNKLRHVEALRADLSTIKAVDKVDGILGMNYFRNKILFINFEAGELSNSRKGKNRELEKNIQKLEFQLSLNSTQMPIMKVERSGKYFEFLVDAGSNVDALNEDYESELGSHLRLKSDNQVVVIPTNSNSNAESNLFNLSSESNLSNFSFDGILSMSRLGFHYVILDFRKSKMALLQ